MYKTWSVLWAELATRVMGSPSCGRVINETSAMCVVGMRTQRMNLMEVPGTQWMNDGIHLKVARTMVELLLDFTAKNLHKTMRSRVVMYGAA